jgi:hypothetical protein
LTNTRGDHLACQVVEILRHHDFGQVLVDFLGGLVRRRQQSS